MYFKPYIELAKNFKALIDFKKSIDLSNIKQLQELSFKDELVVKNSTWNKYKKLVDWKKDCISPIFPYTLLTHLHIRLVSHKLFPSQALGILHKRETIQQFKELKLGKWSYECYLNYFIKVDSGYEVSIMTKLYIDGEQVWQSETLGLVKEKNATTKKNKTVIDKYENVRFEKAATIEVGPFLANQYAWLSGNIDPIHFSVPTAKLMGHPSSIMHGMWSVGRVISEIQQDVFDNTCFQTKFISGLYLPGKADILISTNGKNQVIKLGNPNSSKPYLICEILPIIN